MPPELATFLSAQVLLFVVFALGALLTGVTMVLYPNPVRSALFLVLNLFCVAVLYLLLNAYFLAAVQVIVYTGAIMVLFLFVIMLLNLGSPDRAVDRLKWQQPLAVGAGIVLAAIVSATVAASVPALPPISQEFIAAQRSRSAGITAGDSLTDAAPLSVTLPNLPPEISEQYRRDAMGTVGGRIVMDRDGKPVQFDGIGQVLYNPDLPWLFAFEMTSILLLIAAVGSVVLAKRRVTPQNDVTGEAII